MGLIKDKLKEIFPTFAPLLDDDLEDIVKDLKKKRILRRGH